MKQQSMKSYFSPAFLVCAAVLLTAAAGKEAVIRYFGLVMTKEPIKLQKPLDELDETALAAYKVQHKSIIDRETLESLGTEEYLQWILEDTEAASDSPLRYCSLFITYYTGNPDMVPHVPDECYVGGGKSRLTGQTVRIEVPREKSPDDTQTVGLQYVVFGQAGNNVIEAETTFSVQYLFHVNGRYTEDRTQTRLALGSNWTSPYSYFSKVEWFFFGMDAFGRTYPDKEQTLSASRQLLAQLLPELERNHWPDWQAINAGEGDSKPGPAVSQK